MYFDISGLYSLQVKQLRSGYASFDVDYLHVTNIEHSNTIFKA